MRETREAPSAAMIGVQLPGIVDGVVGSVGGLIARVMAYSWMTTSGAVMKKECMKRSSAASRVRKGRLSVRPMIVL